MAPLKFYLLRAACDWVLDHGFTPHVLADAAVAGAKVPVSYVENGRIVLNIHPRAVRHFDMNEEGLRFSARFGGRSQAVEVPLAAVLAIYARENGQGVTFPEASAAGTPHDEGPPPSGKPPRPGPALKVVK